MADKVNEKCSVCGAIEGKDVTIMLHDDEGMPLCPTCFTEKVGYCVICEQPVNLEHNHKDEKGHIYCKHCMEKGESFAEKMYSIIETQNELEKYGVKIPIKDKLVNLEYNQLKDYKFALSKILSTIVEASN